MSMVKRNGHWIVALAGIVSLAVAAGVMAQKEAPVNGQTAHAVAEARELSTAFRAASKTALPAMVSIETVGRVSTVRGRDVDMDEMFENSPFGELFKNDPRFKDMFRKGTPRQAPRTQGMGSGFIIDSSGIILTASHVVADAERVKVKLHDGREYVATEVKADPRTDVAIVRVKAEESLPTLRLGNSDAVEIGDWVLAIGSPFGLDATVTAGIISAKGRGPRITEREDFLQTDAAINPGNSGGPLINLNGEVVGINSAISTRSGGYDGVGFAVPVNIAKWVADQLIEKGEVSRVYVGVAIQEVTNDLSKQFHVPVGKGAIVTQILPDSPAALSKLEPLDLILKFDGKDVRGPRDLQGIVERLKAGQTYPMLILRDGKEMTLDVQLKEMPRDYALSSDTLVKEHPVETPKTGSFASLGIEVAAPKMETLKQYGYTGEVEGVLITSVTDDSPAANAGLREGMLIQKVGPQKVTSPDDFNAAMEKVELEKGVLMLVRTPRGSQAVAVKGETK